MRELYLSFVEDFANEAVKLLGERLFSVCLFGSTAWGEARQDSDIDILFVADGFSEDIALRHEVAKTIRGALREKRSYSALREFGRSTLTSVVFLTREEALLHPPILLDIADRGVLVYDRDDFLFKVLSDVKARLEALGARRVETSRGWYWVLKPDAKLGEEVRI